MKAHVVKAHDGRVNVIARERYSVNVNNLEPPKTQSLLSHACAYTHAARKFRACRFPRSQLHAEMHSHVAKRQFSLGLGLEMA